MKKLVLPPNPENTFGLEDIATDKFYGARIFREKALITSFGSWSKKHQGAVFFPVFPTSITCGGDFDSCAAENLRDCLVSIVAQQGGEVFEFETYRELLEWVLKEGN